MHITSPRNNTWILTLQEHTKERLVTDKRSGINALLFGRRYIFNRWEDKQATVNPDTLYIEEGNDQTAKVDAWATSRVGVNILEIGRMTCGFSTTGATHTLCYSCCVTRMSYELDTGSTDSD